jgi:hypothetical protein
LRTFSKALEKKGGGARSNAGAPISSVQGPPKVKYRVTDAPMINTPTSTAHKMMAAFRINI